ncbi:unnamed protein product [Paramecium sonneborni]|uniref:Uncharacterized protein n=1 Tax=Paramecium sonneborni TaxID=65129 RepID=A0A8S1LRI6_9CILI|nr:unnamed protein product [Paramecium sonneborni]CAD8067258.1 unnamed protein product [Paramecium sonneborni]
MVLFIENFRIQISYHIRTRTIAKKFRKTLVIPPQNSTQETNSASKFKQKFTTIQTSIIISLISRAFS